jgi:hypothetical protein
MIRPDFRKVLLDQRGAAVILWSLFMISVAVYLVIARNVLGNPKYATGLAFAETARVMLWGLAVVDLGYLVWWKKRHLTRAALLDRSNQAKVLTALEEHQGPVEERAAAVVSTYVTRKIVSFAIIDALAVYGLVLAIVGHYLADQYLLSALTLILLTLEFPTQKPITELLQKLEQSS